ncbi:MAG: 30S ribosomal protein S8 [Firmicutes bacterium]|nr:30S ribosomal protein S8 [Bacillota bacterium]
MVITDPIADLLTRIRNAQTAKNDGCSVPYSKIKKDITQILLDEGYIAAYDVTENEGHQNISIRFKYGARFEKILTNLKRISKPGLRVYRECKDLPRVLDGLGVAIISTSKGVMTDKEARKQNVGGEVLCYIW